MKIQTEFFRDIGQIGRYRRNVDMGIAGEELIMDLLEHKNLPCELTGWNHIVDVIAPPYIMEVKSLSYVGSITMKKEHKHRKIAAAEEYNLLGITVMIHILEEIETDKGIEHIVEITFKEGFKRFTVGFTDDFYWILKELEYLHNGVCTL